MTHGSPALRYPNSKVFGEGDQILQGHKYTFALQHRWKKKSTFKTREESGTCI